MSEKSKSTSIKNILFWLNNTYLKSYRFRNKGEYLNIKYWDGKTKHMASISLYRIIILKIFRKFW